MLTEHVSCYFAGLCNGHFGIIEFVLPVYNTCWLAKMTPKFLKMVCFWCSHPLHNTEGVVGKAATKTMIKVAAAPPHKACPGCEAKFQPTYVRQDQWLDVVWPAGVEFDSKEDEAFATQRFTVRLFCRLACS